MAGRKRHSAEDIVRKLRRADELTAAGKTQEEIAADLEVSAATLYNWRRQYGGMDADAAKELKELRDQNSRLKRLACPSRSSRLACSVVRRRRSGPDSRFQFDSTVDGHKIKIASMVDEHTRMSLLNIVDRSITSERLIEELEKVFAIWSGPPTVLRMDNGPEFISEALRAFCAGGSVGISCIPPGTPWNNGFIESFNNRLRDECLNRNCWTTLLEARVVTEDFKDDHNHRHRHSALGYKTPAEFPAASTSEMMSSRSWLYATSASMLAMWPTPS